MRPTISYCAKFLRHCRERSSGSVALFPLSFYLAPQAPNIERISSGQFFGAVSIFRRAMRGTRDAHFRVNHVWMNSARNVPNALPAACQPTGSPLTS